MTMKPNDASVMRTFTDELECFLAGESDQLRQLAERWATEAASLLWETHGAFMDHVTFRVDEKKPWIVLRESRKNRPDINDGIFCSRKSILVYKVDDEVYFDWYDFDTHPECPCWPSHYRLRENWMAQKLVLYRDWCGW